MADRVPVLCPQCGGDRWQLHRTHGGLSATCTGCETVTAVCDDDPGLSRTEVAEIFRVTPRTVSRWRTAGRLTPVPTAHGVDRYRTADVRALVENPGPCPRGYECAKHPELADLLGHDTQGHAIIKVLAAAGITTRAQLAETELRDVRGLGLTRIVLIRHRLSEAGATEDTEPR